MKKQYSFFASKLLLSFLILVGVLGFKSQELLAVTPCGDVAPKLPELSLVMGNKADGERVYPSGIYRMYPSRGTEARREILVPVFIENSWVSDLTNPALAVLPIYSFKFKVQFDSSEFEFISVQRFGARPQDTVSMAKHFNLSADVMNDTTYTRSYQAFSPDNGANPSTFDQIRRIRGKRVMIAGSSAEPLPTTCGEFLPLVYLKFRYKKTENSPDIVPTMIMITNDSLMYNDFVVRYNVATAPVNQLPFPSRPRFNPENIQFGLPVPKPDNPALGAELERTTFRGLSGIDHSDVPQSVRNAFASFPCIPGSLWFVPYTEFPRLSFTDNNSEIRDLGADPSTLFLRDIHKFNKYSETDWQLIEPIHCNFNNANIQTPATRIMVRNEVPNTRVTNLRVFTDSPWLRVRSFNNTAGATTLPNPIPVATRDSVIPSIDNGLLGVASLWDNTSLNAQEQKVGLEIQVSRTPDMRDNSAERTGMYVGNIYFSSEDLNNGRVKLQVKFFHFKNPLEFYSNLDMQQDVSRESEAEGIPLELEGISQSGGAPQNPVRLIFGTGFRATDGIDSLFGEYAYRSIPAQQDSFWARWFNPELRNFDNTADSVPFGFGDVPLDNNTLRIERYKSRDIRSVYDTTNSLRFYCRFNRGFNINDRIVVTWDDGFFPTGSSLFIRDTLGGQIFSQNMRTATVVGTGTRGTKRSYTIQDARITSFVIEYTPPKTLRFVDENDSAIIKKGWNLLSLPVRPSSDFYKDIYPNAFNKPFIFNGNTYVAAENLSVGTGYFVLYGDDRDINFQGVRISEINANNQVRLLPGWNTIGALSEPVATKYINFAEYQNNPIPSTGQIKSGIYGYQTDRGYREVTELLPGRGYWIDIDVISYYTIKLPPTGKATVPVVDHERNSVLSSSAKLVLRDVDQKEAEVYVSNDQSAILNRFSMPPVPPSQMFDVRFTSNKYVENADAPVIRFQAVKYPVALTIENTNKSYTAVDASTGKVLGTLSSSSPSVVINDASVEYVKLLPSNGAGLDLAVAAYPNPFDVSSTINFSVPAAGSVYVKLYNTMGQEVATIVNGTYNVGTYSVPFSTTTLPTGQYLLKIFSNNNVSVSTVNIVR
ncbi:MAG: T9SS type A sorting domain-containing protein [Candidatus Kapabacteria bacterium]|nr:T9SS type A sorting domain-containing protein [Candidatus Kapabacteria bacterium]